MHTPGPWKYKAETKYAPPQVWIDRNQHESDQLADVYGDSYETRTANAKLMASAPDLLEACKAIAEWYSESGSNPLSPHALITDSDMSVRELLESVIRKAQGEQS